MSVSDGSNQKESLRTRWEAYILTRARAGWSRIKGAIVPNTQAAIFATLSWIICDAFFSESTPIFAPIATYLCMGFSRNREPRKVVEIGIGASLGVLIGGLIGEYLGFGAWQVLLIFAVTPYIARFVDRSDLVTFQTPINALVVASMMTTGMGGPLDRWIHAIVGAAIALVATVIIPTNVVSRPRRFVAFIIRELARTLRKISMGLLEGSPEHITMLRGKLTALVELMSDARSALTSAKETAMVNPSARGSHGDLDELGRMLDLCERMHITVTMIQRQARNMVSEIGPMPDLASPMWQIADLLEEVARGVAEWDRPTDARNEAVALAAHLAPAELADEDDWRSAALVSMVRAVMVDLLQLTGLSQAQARTTLSDIGKANPEAMPIEEEADLASELWGTEEIPTVDTPVEYD